MPSALVTEFLAVAEALHGGDNPFLGRQRLERLERRLARSDLPAERRLVLWPRCVRALLEAGRVDEAVGEARRALDWVRRDARLRATHEARMLSTLAVAYLRQAEVVNCIERPGAACCIFPLRGDGVHAERAPARAAFEIYLELAGRMPAELGARWLLNLTAMAIGEYPAGVPEWARIAPEVFASQADFPAFPNVAGELGVDAFGLCGGVAVADYDGDGHLDIVTSSYEPRTPLVFYRGRPGLAFEEATRGSGLEHQLGGLNLISADYDGDGDPDLLVLRGAWLFDHGAIRNSLLQNQGDGTFRDTTREAGIDTAAPTQAACFGDFDLDGSLDLYVVNESRLEIGPPVGDYPAELWVNQRDGTFVNRAWEAGVANDRYAKGVTAGDYDNDGDLDLYVSNVGPNRLYQNDGRGFFVDVAPALGVDEPTGRSFVPWFFDFDQDGDLDLFVAAFEASLADVAASALGLPHGGTVPRLYRNAGDGRFEDVAAEVGLDRAWLPMGANFGDLDGDGWQDVFLATGEPGLEVLCPNVVLRNDGGRRFLDVTTAGGFGHLQKGHGVAFADFDGDGDQDVYNQLGGFFPADGFRNALFENPGHGTRFLQVELVGTRGNRDAIGARVRVTFEEFAGGRRTLHRAVGSVSSFGGSPLRLELGLGQAVRVLELTVAWPSSTPRQTFRVVPLDARVRVVEGASELELLELR